MNSRIALYCLLALAGPLTPPASARRHNNTERSPIAPRAPHLYFPSVSVRAPEAPPPPRPETRPATPSAKHQWVPGCWTFEDGHPVWLAGAWALPPADGQQWIEPRWVQDGDEWAFIPGRWEGAVASLVAALPVPPNSLVTEVPPPPDHEEPPPEVPPGQAWIPGFWSWMDEHHVWFDGHVEKARPGFVWERARWTALGYKWRLVPGHWQHK